MSACPSLVRTALVGALVSCVAAAGVAAAAPKPKPKPKPKPAPPACNLVVDGKGDTESAPFPASDTIDIVSADIASSATAVTAVLRVAKYTANDTNTIYGKRYLVAFEGGGLQGMYLRALDYPLNGTPVSEDIALPFDFGATEVDAAGRTTYASAGPATGTINAGTGEITITVQAADVAAAGFGKLTPGAEFKSINAVTFRRIGTSLLPGDDASTSKRYVAGSPSCVKVG